MSTVLERFLHYVQVDTTANEEATTCPSNPKEKEFAEMLAKELHSFGLNEISVDQHGYLMATIPANTTEQLPVIGFIAHLDTSPDCSGNVNPQMVYNYQGGNILLNEKKQIQLKPQEFPELLNYLGEDLITTDGTSLLGADDKAGIAAIMTAVERLLQTPFPHGTIKIAFTPDEEIGRGADHFDIKTFGADFAYTIDGGAIGELEYENFNAAQAKITISGVNVHPGYAKGKMKNAALIAAKFIQSFPEDETPAHTSQYQGFYHLVSCQSTVAQSVLKYIIRDFDATEFAARKKFLQQVVNRFQEKYGQSNILLELNDSYYNMKEKFNGLEHIVNTAAEAMTQSGITPIQQPIRGGTDGARLSFMGLPTPNLFAGGHNFHGCYEFIPVMALEKSVQVILKIIQLYGQGQAWSKKPLD